MISITSLVCHLPELRNQPEYYAQKRDLVQLKQQFREYKDIHADVLQDLVTVLEELP